MPCLGMACAEQQKIIVFLVSNILTKTKMGDCLSVNLASTYTGGGVYTGEFPTVSACCTRCRIKGEVKLCTVLQKCSGVTPWSQLDSSKATYLLLLKCLLGVQRARALFTL